MTPKYETHEHDVLIIGAGGAGLRAAIEALAQGARVGVVCKSLLGKAHTVMAEGGIAAAMANVDQADDWRAHFRDTMRGGKFIEQLAHGATPRPGGSRARARTGAMGRAFRPHRERGDSAARLSAATPTNGYAMSATAPVWR